MHIETTLTSKGQMTIPKLFREAIGVKPNEAVELDLSGDRIIIRRKSGANAKKRSFDDILSEVRSLADIPLSTDEIMRMTRGNDWNSATPHD